MSSEAAAILGKLMSAGPTHNWFTSNMCVTVSGVNLSHNSLIARLAVREGSSPWVPGWPVTVVPHWQQLNGSTFQAGHLLAPFLNVIFCETSILP